MFGYGIYSDSLNVINEDIHRHCARLGYRIGRELGRDFYTIAYESYWIDETLGERSLVVKVIDFTHENQLMFVRAHKSETTPRKIKKITVKVGKKKIITIETTIGRRFVPDFNVFRAEINELNYLNHQNLVIIRNILLFDKQSEDESKDLSHILMFIEFNNKNLKEKLKQILKTNQYVTEEQLIHWSAQIVRGLAYLHSRAISHSNLKPSNILVFDNKNLKGGLLLKLCDYGLAMLFPIRNPINQKVDENHLYRDPKIEETFSKLKRKNAKNLCYSATRADIWSLAVIITELRLEFSTLFKLFKDNMTSAKNLGVLYLDKVKIVGSSPKLIDLLSKILIYEQNKRINILAISCHDLIREALKDQRQVTQVLSNENSDSKNDETIDERIDKDSRSNTPVEDTFGLDDSKCSKFISEDDDTIQ